MSVAAKGVRSDYQLQILVQGKQRLTTNVLTLLRQVQIETASFARSLLMAVVLQMYIFISILTQFHCYFTHSQALVTKKTLDVPLYGTVVSIRSVMNLSSVNSYNLDLGISMTDTCTC